MISGEFSVNFTRSSMMGSVMEYLRQPESRQLAPDQPEAQHRDLRPVIPFVDEAWGPTDLTELSEVSAKDLRRIVDARRAMLDKQEQDVYSRNANSVYAPVGSPFAPLFRTLQGGFTVSIVFGGQLGGAKELRFDGGDEWQAPPVLDTIENQIAVGTGIQLIGVSLMSEAMVVADDGRGVISTFTFQARDERPMEQHLLEELSAGFSPKVEDLF